MEQRLQKQYQQAMGMRDEMAGCTATPETRNLTLNDVESALLELDQRSTDGPRLQVVLQKLEKSDYRLYGIKVRCRGRKGKEGKEKGTRVKRGGKTGEVVHFEVDKDTGLNSFEIRWSGGKRELFSTLEVLRGAEDHGCNDDVVSPADDKRRVGLFLRGVLCMVNVQVEKYLIKGNLKTKRTREATRLPSDTKVQTMRIRRGALDDIRETCAIETMTAHELEILGESDEGLLEELKKDASFLELLALRPYCDTDTLGFIEHELAFNSKGHLDFVNHFVRGAQSS